MYFFLLLSIRVRNPTAISVRGNTVVFCNPRASDLSKCVISEKTNAVGSTLFEVYLKHYLRPMT